MVKQKRGYRNPSVGKFVLGTVGTGVVTGTFAEATGSSVGSTLNASYLQGASTFIQPAIKLKGTQMLFKQIGKIKMPMGKRRY